LEGKRDETILESLGEGLVALDKDAKIVLINSQALGLFEIDNRADVVGKPVESSLKLFGEHDVALPQGQRPSYLALRSAKPVDGIYGIIRKDGKKVLININASPVIVN